MDFKKYTHIERLGTTEVLGISLGTSYIFPKLDGTNSSVWLDEKGEIQAGSRNRHLTLEKDNAGFYAWVKEQENIIQYLKENPTHRLYGEWLVPHSLKTYNKEAWNKFYVFDVEKNGEYLHYDIYNHLLTGKSIDFILPICIIENASYQQLINQLNKNVFLIEDGKGLGEGIVIKNYEFKNQYKSKAYAKIVTSEFKEKHTKTMGAPNIKGSKLVEEEIAKEFVTTALVEKVYAKIENETEFNSKSIARLLNTVFYDIVKEETWNFIKKHKNPVINFKTLQHFVYNEVKFKNPNLFKKQIK